MPCIGRCRRARLASVAGRVSGNSGTGYVLRGLH
jgi:hypothetical protein